MGGLFLRKDDGIRNDNKAKSRYITMKVCLTCHPEGAQVTRRILDLTEDGVFVVGQVSISFHF